MFVSNPAGNGRRNTRRICYASVVMEVTDGNPVHVTVFNDVLEKLVPDCKNLTGGEVEEMLLLMENVTITYNSDTCIVLNAVAAK